MSEFWWWHSEQGGVSRRVEACLNLPKERYAMTSDTRIIPLRQPETLEDPLMAALRCGARRLLAQAIEAEAEAFLATMKGIHLPDGRERLVQPCCRDRQDERRKPSPVWVQAVRTEIGRPSSNIRFRAWTATSTSVARRWSVRERSPSPITCLNLPMAASTRARML